MSTQNHPQETPESAPPPQSQNGLRSEQGHVRCPVCGEMRPLGDFPKDATKSSGRASRCKPCDNARNRRYYAANRASRLMQQRRTRRAAKES
jgi:hypothetical protein